MNLPELPAKLIHDSIAEALLEIRFECLESASFPEAVVARVADAAHAQWRGFVPTRLPVSEIPSFIRAQDPNLKHQPTMELREKGSYRVVKVGSNVVSFHNLAPYQGWQRFSVELDTMLGAVFKSFSDFTATRLGFRYINVFKEELHGVRGVCDLNYSVAVAGEPLTAGQNLNYEIADGPYHLAQVRIASPQYVTGPINTAFAALVDVDVFTPPGYRINDLAIAKAWVVRAHDLEKREFFKLFSKAMLERLAPVKS